MGTSKDSATSALRSTRPELFASANASRLRKFIDEALALIEQTEAERIEAELAARAEADADAERAKCLTLAGFIRAAWPILEPATPYIHGWHIDAICEHLEAVSAGVIDRLLINVPPGSMKSLITAVFWPAWEWGPAGMPHLRYLSASYEEGLAVRDNVKMRRLVESAWYQRLWPNVRMQSDQNAKTKFENSAMGGRECRAFTSLTGGRGDRVIIDDPHSTKAAESQQQRTEAVKIMRESVPSRVNGDKSAIVVIMQRLHDQDVSGAILADELGYCHLCIPMEWEPNDQRGKQPIHPTAIGWVDPRTVPGELMSPEQFTPRMVERLRKMGTYAYAGQYQQRPSPRSGGLFQVERIEVVKAAPAGLKRRYRAWDYAASVPKAGADPDWTVGVLMGVDAEGFYYIEDVVRGQWTAAAVREITRATATRDGKKVRIRLPQDPGQAGKEQAQDRIRMLAGFSATAATVRGDKATRADPLAVQIEAGNVRMVEGPWNAAFIEELRGFPAGHDDQVDAAADAFNALAAPGAQGWLDYYREQHERRMRGQDDAGDADQA